MHVFRLNDNKIVGFRIELRVIQHLMHVQPNAGEVGQQRQHLRLAQEPVGLPAH